MPNTPDNTPANTPANRNRSERDWTLFGEISFMRPFLIAVAITAIYTGAIMTAFNIARHDFQQRTECRTLRPLTMPFKGTLP